jgi:ubiquitin-conjugating enzyme E2 Q
MLLTSIALFQIEEMKKHLERKVSVGKSKPKLREIDPSISPAAWLILRWYVLSFDF